LKNLIYKISLLGFDFLFLILIFYFSNKLLNANYSITNFLFIILIILISFYYEKIYDVRYDFWQETKKIFNALLISYLIILALSVFTKSMEYSKFLSLFFLISFMLFPIYRRFLKKILFKFDFFKENVKIIGKKEKFLKEIQNNWYLGMKENEKFDSVIIISKFFDISKLDKIIDKYIYDKKIYLVPFLDEINFMNSEIIEFYNIRLNAIKVENKLLEKKNIFIKNLFDYILAILLLPVFLIIHIFISILIKSDSSGSIFFKQKRIGKNGKIFICYKYRTMYGNGDEILKEYLKEHPEEKDYYEKYHKYRNDLRITKIGKILRSTSLDELPQIINVLKGEMSFIGPRPYLPKEILKLNEYKDFIFKIKPGITGLWQVSGRNNLTFRERVKLEKWYIKNWSLWGDFVILIKTVKAVLLKIGAK
jgi:lipopolysaccharide/colanic/teichoic acid biosynthesis glycosyltransferase